jgi:hypothetical protein
MCESNSRSPGFLATVAPKKLARSLLLENLTPASGCQDHTTSPSAGRTLVSSAADVHRIPPHVRDDRETPLCVGRDGEGYAGDLPQTGTEIFLQRGLDRWNRIEPKGEFSLCRHSSMCNCASAGTPDGSPFKICEFIPHDSSRL